MKGLYARVIALVFAAPALTMEAAVIVQAIVPAATLYEPFPSQPIDFNSDGIPELVLSATLTEAGGWVNEHVQLQALAALPPNLGSWATPVPLGMMIAETPSSIGTWLSPSAGLFTFRVALDVGSAGYWPAGMIPPPLNPDGSPGLGPLVPESGYLGVFFSLPDGIHYGWVEVGVYPNASLGYLRSYGWETEPNTPIIAGSVPEPGRLLLFLAGGFAVVCRRRRVAAGAAK